MSIKKMIRIIIVSCTIIIFILSCSSCKILARKDTQELNRAILANDINKVEQLIEEGVDLNARPYYGLYGWLNYFYHVYTETPLCLAARCNRFEIVKLLVENGADVNLSCGEGGSTPLYCAIEGNGMDSELNFDIAYYLIAHGADINKDVKIYGGNILVNLANHSYGKSEEICAETFEFVKFLQEEGAKVKPLALSKFAMYDGNLETTKYLIEICGYDPNGLSEFTPLMSAASSGAIDTCQYLLRLGVNKNIKSSKGWTAYDYAVNYEKWEVVELLKNS